MINQITKGIKISVKTKYNGTSSRNYKMYHIFEYAITIENKSSETVKLTDRLWKIYDTLNNTQIVSGSGVVGQTPTLKPTDIYTYTSGCFLESSIGSMSGFYTMINMKTFEQFKVIIPTFQLTNQTILN